MTAKPKFPQEIGKLIASSTRLKELITGRLIHYWPETLKGGKTKICAVLLDGHTYTNVLVAEAWTDADQAHADRHLKPHIGQVVALENAKIVSKGKTTGFHSKQIKAAYDRQTIVKHLDDDHKFGKALPLTTLTECNQLPTLCAVSLIVVIQDAQATVNRPTEGGQKPVSNCIVALEGLKIDAAFWGDQLANTMGKSKKGDVYRLDWITLVVQAAENARKLLKLTSNQGTKVELLQGTDAENVRNAVQDNLISMSPQYRMSRDDKLKLTTSRMLLSLVSHMRDADISQDSSTAYKCAIITPCIFLIRRQRQRFAVLPQLPSVQEKH